MTGTGAKIGEWYEAGYVVWQFIRLLEGRVDAVLWEGIDEDEKGVDVWVTEEGRRFACQCKHLKLGSWTWEKLKKPPRRAPSDKGKKNGANTDQSASPLSILAYAAEQLSRDPEHRYRLVTSVPAVALDDLITSAKRDPIPVDWWESRKPSEVEPLASAWALKPDQNPEHLGMLHDRLRRMEVVVTGNAMVQRASHDGLARILDAQDPAVAHAIIGEVCRKWLARSVNQSEAQTELTSRGVSLATWPGDTRIGTLLREQCDRFLFRTAPPSEMPVIARPNLVDQVLNGLEAAIDGKVVLLQGEPGSGKSWVLSEAVRALAIQGTPILCLSLDGDDLLDEKRRQFRLPGAPGEALSALKRYAAGKQAAIVVDQLDNVAWAGGASQPRSEAVRLLLMEWRNDPQDIRVVMGCRSVDARTSTQVGQWVSDSGRRQPINVVVGDLPEPEVTRILTQESIQLQRCEPTLLRLLARPLLLGIALRLARSRQSLAGLASLTALIRSYWDWVHAHLDSMGLRHEGEGWLDILTQRMQDDAALSISVHRLPIAPAVIEALNSLGVICRAGDHIRPGHQVLLDYRIAVRLADDIPRLTAVLANRSRQDLVWSGRMRLAVPLLREAGHFRHLRAAVESSSTRWMLRQAVLRAMAQEESPRAEEVDAVVAWLALPDLRNGVIRDLLEGRPRWIEALERNGWIRTACESGDPVQRAQILSLVSTVAQAWGDGVARIVSQIRDQDQSLLVQAQWAFWHPVAADSDALFELRLEYARKFPERSRHMSIADWSALIDQHPERACRLLISSAERLLQRDPEEKEDHWVHDLLGQQKGEALGRSFPSSLCQPLIEQWNHAVMPEHFWDLSGRVGGPSIREKILWLLSGNIAKSIDERAISFSEIVSLLPHPLRTADIWLLLRSGSSVLAPSQPFAEDAMRWFCSDRRYACTRVTASNAIHQKEAIPFVVRLVPCLGGSAFDAFESWLLHYLEPNIIAREEYRRDEGRYSHPMLTSHMGETPWRLFTTLFREVPHLQERVKSTTISQVGCWQVKFGHLPSLYFNGSEFSGVYSPTSPISETTARTWKCAQWLRIIRNPSVGNPNNHWGKNQHSPDTLGNLLYSVASNNPIRFLDLARSLNDQDHETVRRHLLRSLIQESGKGGPPAIGTGNLIEIIDYPAWAGSTFVSTLCEAVRHWPKLEWSDAFFQRLASEAAKENTASYGGRGVIDQLSFTQINRPDCVALNALILIAKDRPLHRDSVTDLCRSFSQSSDLPRRSQGILGLWMLMQREEELLQMIPCFRDVHLVAVDDYWRLFRYFSQYRFSEVEHILDALVAHEDPHVSKIGGFLLGVLRCDGLPMDGRIEDVLSKPAISDSVKTGLAEALGGILREEPLPEWLDGPLLRLAECEKSITWSVISPFYALSEHKHLLKYPDLVIKLSKTKAGINHASSLIHGFDEVGDLEQVQDAVLALTSGLTNADELDDIVRHQAEDLAKLLYRLLEQAERNRNEPLRQQCLDGLDRLIEIGLPQVRSFVEELIVTNASSQ